MIIIYAFCSVIQPWSEGQLSAAPQCSNVVTEGFYCYVHFYSQLLSTISSYKNLRFLRQYKEGGVEGWTLIMVESNKSQLLELGLALFLFMQRIWYSIY